MNKYTNTSMNKFNLSEMITGTKLKISTYTNI